MNTNELREKYLTFFEEKGCVRRPSDVLVPKDDKSILFTPAGMNQFKNQFLGIGPLEFTKATTCQKCLRTGDIGNVGVTAYHHTFFEMLGNFSFGDYFKKEAIHWAWEFCTSPKWLGLDPSRLRVTVFLNDDEAFGIWNNEIKLPADRISRENEHENFWPAGAPSLGPDGVCGPCSEIYFHPPGAAKDVEIWNLVFTQFNRVGDPPDNLRPLPKKNIDTGMGLERTASVLQGCESNFGIDILLPIVKRAAAALGVEYLYQGPTGRPLRRISDHVRAITFCIHEGVAPGNELQGYIVKQLLRRAFLEGYLLGKQEPFLYLLVPTVIEMMKVPYPELSQTMNTVQDTIKDEEENFLATVERGIGRYRKLVEQCQSSGSKVISGDDAFDLHQTDGFLFELTQAMAERDGLSVDLAKFKSLVEKHKQTSGRGAFDDSVMAAGPLAELHRSAGQTEFLGYGTLSSEGRVVGLISQKSLVPECGTDSGKSTIAIVLDKTPFYGESGGQVGDTGTIKADGLLVEIEDTKRDGNLVLHIGSLKQGTIRVGMTVQSEVDPSRRAGIRRAHSATHILHHALQNVLGSHAVQRGSKVEEDVLRFDFAQPKQVTSDQLQEIEDLMHARIQQSSPISWEVMELAQAKKLGAMALFGEKYPDRVRVVRMGDFSRELCGGTHLENTGMIGYCRVLSEESVAKGIRRITVITGPKAVQQARENEGILQNLSVALKSPRLEDLPDRLESLQNEIKELRQLLAKQQAEAASSQFDQWVAQAPMVSGIKLIVQRIEEADIDQLRNMIDVLKRKASPAAVLLGSVREGKVSLLAGLSKEVVDRGLSAVDWVKAAAKHVGGGGGGRPDLAQAGGKSPELLPEALKAGLEFIQSKLG